MKFRKLLTSLALSSALVAAHTSAIAEEEDQAGLQVGILKCKTVSGSRVNLLVRSTADVKCVFKNQDVTEHYAGETGIALGLDLSFKDDEVISFAVIAASSDVTPGGHSLQGKYVGGKLAAAAGVGLGAAALIGGGDNNFSLQPLGVETSTGLGISGGIGFLYIEKSR